MEKNALSDVTLGSLLDDKKLLSDFELILNKSYKEKEAQFSKDFLNQLLKTRLLFDKFIIKRESVKESSNWSLKELKKSDNKKAYYVNTVSDNQECLMIQAALRVSYTSPKIMHWITELLKLDNFDNLSEKAEHIAAKATKDNFLEKENAFNLGVGTPHIVFNYLDYLLWKEDKNQDFQFEFRNSVEHFHPQNPENKSQNWGDDKDMFGNLCLMPRNINSKFSNLLPKAKLEGYKQHIDKGSLKLRKMRELTNKKQEWSQDICKEHQEAMIKKLQEAVEYLIKDIVDK